MPAWDPDELRRWITVHADGGFRDGRGRAGFLLRSSFAPFRIVGARDIPKPVPDSTTAEAVAILYGIRAALATWGPDGAAGFDVDGIGGFFVRSDSLACVEYLNSGRGNLCSAARAALDAALDLTGGYGLNVKHVCGHGRDANPSAAWANARADEAANLRGR